MLRLINIYCTLRTAFPRYCNVTNIYSDSPAFKADAALTGLSYNNLKLLNPVRT